MSANSSEMPAIELFQFPRWANYLVPILVLAAIGVCTYLPLVLSLFLSPHTTDVRYRPVQPVPFSHAMHAGELQIDCRYCHSSVEQAAYAAIPSTKVCMNCHASIKSNSEQLAMVRDSFASGDPIPWVKVHDQPDFVFFNHAAHVNQGVACVSCHGRIDQMDVVYQHEPLSMAWCLECHRHPAPHLRPRNEITNMDWRIADSDSSPTEFGRELMSQYQVHSPEFMTNCTLCHR